MTTNRHGWRLWAEGAHTAASSRLSIRDGSTGRDSKRRIERRARIKDSTSAGDTLPMRNSSLAVKIKLDGPGQTSGGCLLIRRVVQAAHNNKGNTFSGLPPDQPRGCSDFVCQPHFRNMKEVFKQIRATAPIP